MTNYVVEFCNRHQIILDKRTADNWRRLPFSIKHHHMRLGVCKEGITDGLHAYVQSLIADDVVHVHWSNCLKADTGENAQLKTGKNLRKIKDKPEKESKPRKISAQAEKMKKLDSLLDLI